MRRAEPRSFQCSPAQNGNRARTVADTASREEFAERTDSLVRDLGTRSRFSVHTMKRLIDLTGADEPRLAEAWARGWTDVASGPDLPIDVDAFLQGRAPIFSWIP